MHIYICNGRVCVYNIAEWIGARIYVHYYHHHHPCTVYVHNIILYASATRVNMNTSARARAEHRNNARETDDADSRDRGDIIIIIIICDERQGASERERRVKKIGNFNVSFMFDKANIYRVAAHNTHTRYNILLYNTYNAGRPQRHLNRNDNITYLIVHTHTVTHTHAH